MKITRHRENNEFSSLFIIISRVPLDMPVIRLGHLSETQRRALVIADNRIAENANCASPHPAM